MTKDAVKDILKKHRVDIIVISALLLISVLLIVFVNVFRRDGAMIEIEQGGEVIAKYPLDKNGVYELNGGTNVITVEAGVAYMSYSDCPDHTCENIGKVKYVGQTIVCLPNKLTVTVVGESDGAVDFVS